MNRADVVAVGVDPAQFAAYFKHDMCFGCFSGSADECDRCTLPVVVAGRVHLLREVCEAETRGFDVVQDIQSLTTQDILDRLNRGDSVYDIFAELIGENDPEAVGALARKLMVSRFRYINRKKQLPVPKVPSMEELVDVHNSPTN